MTVHSYNLLCCWLCDAVQQLLILLCTAIKLASLTKGVSKNIDSDNKHKNNILPQLLLELQLIIQDNGCCKACLLHVLGSCTQ